MTEAKKTSISRDARAINIEAGRTLDRLRRQIASMFEMTQTLRTLTETAGTDDQSVSNNQVAKLILRERRRRDSFFDPELFGEPAWDMLLELYVQKLDQSRISVSGLCSSSGVPATTALRWIGKLEHEGLIARRSDPLDQRRTWIELSPEAKFILDSYFNGLVLAA